MRRDDIITCNYCGEKFKLSSVLDDFTGYVCLECAVDQYPATYPRYEEALALSLHATRRYEDAPTPRPSRQRPMTEAEKQIFMYHWVYGEILGRLYDNELTLGWLVEFLAGHGFDELNKGNIHEASRLLQEHLETRGRS